MESEFQRMQREATEKMLEMNSRAKANGTNMPPTPSFVSVQGSRSQSQSQKAGPPPKSNALSSLLSSGSLDDDKILVLGLLFLLFRDNSDPILMLALLYILL